MSQSILVEVEGIEKPLEFPQGTDPAVIQRTVKSLLAQNQPSNTDLGAVKKNVAKERAMGIVEPVATMLSSAAGDVVGGLAGLGQIPIHAAGLSDVTPSQMVKQWQSKLGYEPTSDTGKDVLQTYGETLEPIAEFIDQFRTGDETLEATGSPALATVNEVWPELATTMFGFKGFGKKTGLPKPKTGPIDPRIETINQAKRAGYKMPPSHVNPTVGNRLVEGLSGKAQTQQSAAFKNQNITNRLVRESLGLKKDTPITHESLKQVRDKAVEIYKKIAKSGEVKVDDGYMDDLQRLSKDIDTLAKDFPDANLGANVEISKLIDSLLKDSFDAKGGLEFVKQLRKDATAAFSGQYDPTKRALAVAQRQAADALEDMLGRHMAAKGSEGAQKAFNDARRTIAKTYTVEAALNEGTGNVIATKIGDQLRKGKPLSGELELIGKFARSFPKAAKEVTDSPGVSAVDSFIAGGGAMGTASGMPLASPMMAWPAIRIGAREGILSKPYQNSLMPQGPKPPLRNKNMALAGALLALENDKNKRDNQ